MSDSSESDSESKTSKSGHGCEQKYYTIQKTYKQKFCNRWKKDFPWASEYKSNPNYAFCKTCDSRLSCKKSHILRHQKSSKHQKNMLNASNISEEDGKKHESGQSSPNEFERVFMEALDCEKKEPMDEHCGDDEGREDSSLLMYEKKPAIKNKMPLPNSTGNVQLDRLALLKRIEGDKCSLNESYAKLKPAARDTFELFFDSVCSSVKALPAKLAAEAKINVMKLIGELEIRAIYEREALSSAHSSSAILANSETSFGDIQNEVRVTVAENHHNQQSMNQDIVPQIIYTFQPKTS